MSERKTVNITIDGKKIQAPVDQPILQTALDNGIDIPYFCYHKDLGPDGNCRMCLVEIEKIKKPQISCMTYPTEGMVIFTQNERIKALRKAVLELILVNHPLDCPICDKVGECELQENYFRFSGAKSNFPNPYAKVRHPKLTQFSERILYDGERCIKCARCTRFTQEVSKSYWLGLTDRGVHAQVKPSVSECKDKYSDCVIDICPVGALTSTKFRFKARVYTLKSTSSVCPFCSRGCNVYIQHKHEKIYRVIPRCNREVNKSWMCNAGRDIEKYTDRERCSKAFQLGKEIGYTEAWERMQSWIKECRKKGKKVVAIASSFGSDEEIGAFVELFKNKLGASVFFKTDSTLNKTEYPADNFLITDDKNPSRYTLSITYGLKEIENSIEPMDSDLWVVWGEGLSNSLSHEKIEQWMSKAKQKILLTPFAEPGIEKYDLVIPVPTYFEKSGTYTNVEGKKSRFLAAITAHAKDELMLFEELRFALVKSA